MNWIVVAAGQMRNQAFWQKCLKNQQTILCADAGYTHCQLLGIQPKALIGDFDSYPNPPQELELIKLNKIKDISDTQAAIDHAICLGASSVSLLGGTGSRLDHSLVNFNLLSLYPGKLKMLDGDFEALALDQDYQFNSELNATCTLIPYGSNKTVISTQGLRYGLDKQSLRADSQGLSNLVTETSVRITVHEGKLILLRIWEPFSNRLPLTS